MDRHWWSIAIKSLMIFTKTNETGWEGSSRQAKHRRNVSGARFWRNPGLASKIHVCMVCCCSLISRETIGMSSCTPHTIHGRIDWFQRRHPGVDSRSKNYKSQLMAERSHLFAVDRERHVLLRKVWIWWGWDARISCSIPFLKIHASMD